MTKIMDLSLIAIVTHHHAKKQIVPVMMVVYPTMKIHIVMKTSIQIDLSHKNFIVSTSLITTSNLLSGPIFFCQVLRRF
jgi:hypothetical protein